jgi:hypothetical protein
MISHFGNAEEDRDENFQRLFGEIPNKNPIFGGR